MDLTTIPSELKEKSFEYEIYYNGTTLVKKAILEYTILIQILVA